MKAAARRLLALENSSGQVASVVEAEAERDRALHMMTAAERALAQVALGVALGEKSWDDHDQAEWGWSVPFIAARREIEAADKETARFLASALMTRGRWRWLGRLKDVRLAGC